MRLCFSMYSFSIVFLLVGQGGCFVWALKKKSFNEGSVVPDEASEKKKKTGGELMLRVKSLREIDQKKGVFKSIQIVVGRCNTSLKTTAGNRPLTDISLTKKSPIVST
ncbi:hypothetical protein PGT21_002954 [Puccinia graminis f. sp. tritici]|uniref:Uncharacterized protein n=1 Tax=Puccinia graminis f. sp. tritici TaxID=56615 RepID=A0A5B0QH88_PUCGR|nr:hypothetical protein PGT21_002954 [Puccinia graminis f. sp. tritici]